MSDYTEERRKNPSPWCIEHHEELKDIWTAIRGNGHPENGLVYKTQILIDRQEVIKSKMEKFFSRIDRAFWWVVGTSLVGVFSALGAFVILSIRLLMEHGKL
jgi:hypothetical protein